ncbi:MAG: hypothetical protein LKI18_04125 [Prevotella sp.]|jgi:hypothetical protein|nr:hypothetical protein [Prevotella sp.]
MKNSKNSRPFQFLFEGNFTMAFKKQSVSEMWIWMTESHLRTCAQIPVHLSVSTKGCPDLTNQLPGQLTIDKICNRPFLRHAL